MALFVTTCRHRPSALPTGRASVRVPVPNPPLFRPTFQDNPGQGIRTRRTGLRPTPNAPHTGREIRTTPWTKTQSSSRASRSPTARSRRSAASTSALRPAASSGCSAPTAPARRPRSASSPRCCSPTRARPRRRPRRRAATPRRCARRSASPASTPPSTRTSPASRTSRWSAGCTTCAARGARARADELLERFDLADAAKRPAKTYSGGMRRRLDLAAALVVPPAGPVPRRADHRARPAQPARHVGDDRGPHRGRARPCC